MMSGTQSTVSTGVPLVLPTSAKQPLAKLVVRGEQDQIVQQWLVLQNKCTLGSASACALRCQLPGIAAYHALLVFGAKQVFIRALSPKLTRNGVSLNEILLNEEDRHFEIAGHRFELIRSLGKSTESPKQSASDRLKFTLARPFEMTARRSDEDRLTSTSSDPALPRTEPNKPSKSLFTPGSNPATQPMPEWINNLIQSAIQPIEQQLQSIVEADQSVQSDAPLKRPNRRRKPQEQQRERKLSRRRVIANVRPINEQATTITPSDLTVPIGSTNHNAATVEDKGPQSPSKLVNIDQAVHTATNAIDEAAHAGWNMVCVDSYSLDAGPRDLQVATCIASNFEAIDFLKEDTVPAAPCEPAKQQQALGESKVQSQPHSESKIATSSPVKAPTPPTIDPQIEALIEKHNASLQMLSERIESVAGQLNSLERTVQDNAHNIEKIQQDPSKAIHDETLQRITLVTERLSVMMQDLQSRQSNLESSDQEWRDSLSRQMEQLQDKISATERTVQQAVSSVHSAALTSHDSLQASVDKAIAALESKSAEFQSAIDDVRIISQQAQSAAATPIPQAATPGNPINTIAQPFQSQQPSPGVFVEAMETAIRTAPAVLPVAVASLDMAQGLPAQDYLVPMEQGSPPKAIGNAWLPKALDTEQQSETSALVDGHHRAKTGSSAFIDPTVSQDANLGLTSHDVYDDATYAVTPLGWNESPTAEAGETATESGLGGIIENDFSGNGSEANSYSESALVELSGEQEPQTIWDAAGTGDSLNADSFAVSAGSPKDSSPQLPSWWTDDDKSQFEEDRSISLSRASVSPQPSNVEAPALSIPPANEDGFGPSISNEFAPSTPTWAKDDDDDLPSPTAPTVISSGTANTPLDSVESAELAMLLERFGAPGASSEEPAQSPILDEVTQHQLADYSVADDASDSISVADRIEADYRESESHYSSRMESGFASASEPSAGPGDEVANRGEPSSAEEESEEDEESIEDYMKRLMARMRGDSEPITPGIAKKSEPVTPPPQPTAHAVARDPSTVRPPARKTEVASSTERRTGVGAATTAAFNPDEYVPKALAPEKSRNMAAMRELANNSARSAIQVSTRRRYSTAIALKLVIATIGFIVGCVLILLNGFNVNIGLIATVASFLVAIIWGIDAASTIKPMLTDKRSASQPAVESPEVVEEA